MHTVLVIGAGKIGSLITYFLSQSKHYQVYLADNNPDNIAVKKLGELPNFTFCRLDANDTTAIAQFVVDKHINAIISSLPYYCNLPIAKVAAEKNIHYFDLTEDVSTTQTISTLSKQSTASFVPQCGLAPGFISIIANDLMQHFPQLETVKMRVGALPTNSSNALQYALTWSTDGLINEYGNPCQAIEQGKLVTLQALEGLEEIIIDGLTYEAFNTSGGVGSLVRSYQGKVDNLSYKTMRYPGHCEKIKFLMNDLHLNQDRDTLKRIFEKAIPKTLQDVVLVYVSVTGTREGQLVEENFSRKYYPQNLGGLLWSAIQLTTASGICAAVDLVLNDPQKYKGFVNQEQFSFENLISNKFGAYYKE